MGLSMESLAKARGVSAEASNRAVEAVKKVGFGTEDAIHAVDRLMVADMKLSKAEGLAKVAKDAAAIENITPGEALEKLLMAVESGASRGLRTMGIFVDLNKELDRQEKLTGRTLDENEIRQLRYNAVMREAAKIQGAAAAATGSAEEQSAALAREVNELKDAVGEQFQGYLRSWVGHLRDLVGFLKDNSDWLVKFGEAAIFVAGAIVTYGIITKIAGIASAVEGLALALTANPIALLLLAPGNQKIYLTTTHCHPEHAGGDAGFPAGTVLVKNAVQQREMEAHGKEMVELFAGRSTQFRELLADTALRAPDVTFEQEARLDVGDVTARLLWFGGAHTKGDELTFVEPDRTLVSGDVVQNKVVPGIFRDGGTPSSWLAVLDRLRR
jgi:glyoxylase-like metal-dependent hydrolase (beta-lactamase superfamily II)